MVLPLIILDQGIPLEVSHLLETHLFTGEHRHQIIELMIGTATAQVILQDQFIQEFVLKGIIGWVIAVGGV